jgi:transposase-like protein
MRKGSEDEEWYRARQRQLALEVVEQTLGKWVRQHRAGTLKGATSKPQVTAGQTENSRLRAELTRGTMG